MTEVNSARFTIDGTPSEDPTTGDRGYTATASQTLDITLEENPSSALSVLYQVYDSAVSNSPLSSLSAPELTWVASGTSNQSFTNVNDTAQIIMPSSGTNSFLVRCTVSTASSSHVFERLVATEMTVTTPTLRKTIPAETTQFRERSWSDDYNLLVEAIGGLSFGTFNMDATHNAFGSNPAIVVVDNAEGQGDMRFNPSGAFSLKSDISGCTGALDGFQIENGTDYWHVLYNAADSIDFETQCKYFDVYASDSFSINGVDSSQLVVSGAAADLTLGGRAATITLNETGYTSLSGFTATSIIGALNEVKKGSTLDGVYDNETGYERTITIDDYDVSWDLSGTNSFVVDISGATGTADGFFIENGTNYFRINRLGANNSSLEASFYTASSILVTGSSEDLTLGARAATITLNQSGDTTLDAIYGAAGATSIIGAFNVLASGPGLLTDLDEGYDNFGSSPASIEIDNSEGQGSLTWNTNSTYEFAVDVSGSSNPQVNGDTDPYGFIVSCGADYFKIGRQTTDQIRVLGQVQTFDLNAASYMTFDSGDSISIDATTTIDWSGTNAALTTSGALTLASTLSLTPMTSGSVLFAGAGGVISQDNTNLYWDSASGSLGIGDGSPDSRLSVSPAGGTASPSMGTDEISNGDFATDLSGWSALTGWSWSSGTALHTAGDVLTLRQNVTTTSTGQYVVEVKVTGRTAGTVVMTWASSPESYDLDSNSTFTHSFTRGATGTFSLTFTPTTDFDGAIDDVSLKLITPASTYDVSLGGGSFSVMTGGPHNNDSTNLFIGALSGRYNVIGRDNVFLGYWSGSDNTTGYDNLFLGSRSGAQNRIGYRNTFIGDQSGYSTVDGYENTYIGKFAGRYITGGFGNCYIGVNSGGTSQSCSYCTAIGRSTSFDASSDTNETAIGNGAIGIGSNTVTLGNSSVTQTRLGGIISTINGGVTTGYIDDSLSMGHDTSDDTSWIQSAGTSATDLYLNPEGGNVGVGGTTFDSTADRVFQISGSTEPGGSVADTIQLYEKDSSQGAGHGTLGLYLEEAVETIGTFTASHKLRLWINGTEYWVQLDAV